MRKVIFQAMITLDGYFEGIGKELDWHHVDEEFQEYAATFLETLDTLIFGRVNYEMMEQYWTSEIALKNDSVIANFMNNFEKVVFSSTLKNVNWNNSRLVHSDPIGEILRLKELPGKDIAIFGSSDLSLELVRKNLIDEYRIFVNPLFLGSGKTLFAGLGERINVKLNSLHKFTSGMILLNYIK